MTVPSGSRLGLRAAPWLLWFGVLGSAVAWSLHTVVDWGIDETVCRSGHDEMAGVPLRPLLGGLSLLFFAVSVASTVVAYRLWRQLDGAEAVDDLQALRQHRASFMALVGFVAGILFTLMTLFSSIAVLVFSACTQS